MFARNPFVCQAGDDAWPVVHRLTGKRLPGVGNSLKDAFYPDAEYDKLTAGPLFNIYESKWAEKYETPYAGRARKPGLGTGIRVDNEITACIKGNKVPQPYQRGACAFFGSMRSGANGRMKLMPEDAQLPVADLTIPMGTRLDVVCVSADAKKDNKSVIIIEVKTGFKGYLQRHTGANMHAPLDKYDDSPHNQHHLQLLLGCHMFRCTWPQFTIAAAYVVYINDCTAVWIKLHASMEAKCDAIVNALRVKNHGILQSLTLSQIENQAKHPRPKQQQQQRDKKRGQNKFHLFQKRAQAIKRKQRVNAAAAATAPKRRQKPPAFRRSRSV